MQYLKMVELDIVVAMNRVYIQKVLVCTIVSQSKEWYM